MWCYIYISGGAIGKGKGKPGDWVGSDFRFLNSGKVQGSNQKNIYEKY